jgi:hypothetical protein
MRNDANDDFDDVPSLRADSLDDDDFVPSTRTAVHSRTPPVVKVRAASTGPLWALVGALFFAFAGLAWWSFQQISLMEQQLVATQESFARISEEAAGRLQDISGKVVASQTNVTSDSEARKPLNWINAWHKPPPRAPNSRTPIRNCRPRSKPWAANWPR